FTWAAGTSSKTLIDTTEVISHDPDGTFSGLWAASIGATGTQGIGGPTYNGDRYLTFPTLTVVPGTPTGVTASRVSDSQVSVSWSQVSASNGEPTSVQVQRRVNGGSAESAGSYSPTTSVTVSASGNQKLEYRVRQ